MMLFVILIAFITVQVNADSSCIQTCNRETGTGLTQSNGQDFG